MDGALVHYQSVWQRKNLVLVTVPSPSPGVLVADRWGEIYYIKGASRAADLPSRYELVEWVRYVQNECPECQGETR